MSRLPHFDTSLLISEPERALPERGSDVGKHAVSFRESRKGIGEFDGTACRPRGDEYGHKGVNGVCRRKTGL